MSLLRRGGCPGDRRIDPGLGFVTYCGGSTAKYVVELDLVLTLRLGGFQVLQQQDADVLYVAGDKSLRRAGLAPAAQFQ